MGAGNHRHFALALKPQHFSPLEALEATHQIISAGSSAGPQCWGEEKNRQKEKENSVKDLINVREENMDE